MEASIKSIQQNDLNKLKDISIQTFKETFGSDNSEEDLQNYFKTAYNLPKLAKELANPNSEFYFIFYNHNLAGYLKLNIEDTQSEKMGDNALEIERIYIRRSFKHLGLGSKFINFSIERAKKLNKKIVWLGVWEHNESAQSFYIKKGFRQFGDHIFQLGEDAQRDILMKKSV